MERLSESVQKMFTGGFYDWKYCLVCKKQTKHKFIGSDITGMVIYYCMECKKRKDSEEYNDRMESNKREL